MLQHTINLFNVDVLIVETNYTERIAHAFRMANTYTDDFGRKITRNYDSATQSTISGLCTPLIKSNSYSTEYAYSLKPLVNLVEALPKPLFLTTINRQYFFDETGKNIYEQWKKSVEDHDGTIGEIRGAVCFDISDSLLSDMFEIIEKFKKLNYCHFNYIDKIRIFSYDIDKIVYHIEFDTSPQNQKITHHHSHRTKKRKIHV